MRAGEDREEREEKVSDESPKRWLSAELRSVRGALFLLGNNSHIWGPQLLPPPTLCPPPHGGSGRGGGRRERCCTSLPA